MKNRKNETCIICKKKECKPFEFSFTSIFLCKEHYEKALLYQEEYGEILDLSDFKKYCDDQIEQSKQTNIYLDESLNKQDKLFLMFEKQKNLQQKLGNNNILYNQEYINIMTIAAIDELMEALRETPFKPWKKQQQFNHENFKKELIDAWHFILNLSLAAGFTSEELFESFCDKNKENHVRQETGY